MSPGPWAAGSLMLGTAQWGSRYGIANRSGPPTPDMVGRMLALAARAGVRAVDTARGYPGSEAALGLAGVPAGRWTVVTKLDPSIDLSGAGPAAAGVARSLADSRRSLRRRRLDVVLLHRPAQRQACGGAVWQALQAARAAGRIGALGVSAVTPEDAVAAARDPEVEVVQVAYSLFDRRLEATPFFDIVRTRELAVSYRSVFLQGALLLEPARLPPHLGALRVPLQAVGAWADDHGLERREALLLFARARATGPVLVGTERPGQLEATLRTWDRAPLTAGQLRELEALVPPFDDDVVDPSRWPAA